MSDKENWRKVLKENRLQHQLEIQSRQIEKVFTHHEVPAHVAGGTVRPRSISFDLQEQVVSGWEWLRDQVKRELTSVLGGTDVRLSRENGQLQLHVDRPDNPPVPLLDLLPLLPETLTVTAILGLAEDSRPVLLPLAEVDMTPVLLAGEQDAGKTALLRTIAVSLALTNKQSQVQLLVIDGGTPETRSTYGQLEPLTYLPHLLMPVIYDAGEASEVLTFLADEIGYRGEQDIGVPHVVVLIDSVVALLEAGGRAVADALVRLARRGAPAGIHLVMSSERPEAPIVADLFKANFPVRLVGRARDEQQAAVAAGVGDSQAQYLLGQGDFLAVTDSMTTHFQAAYIGDYDLHLTLEALHRNRPRPLLAQPMNVRPTLAPPYGSQREEEQHFRINLERVTPEAEADEADALQPDERPERVNEPLFIKGGRK